MDKDTALDFLEIMNSQVLNGGFYQYYYNVVEHEPHHLVEVRNLARLGSNAKMQLYPELVQILREYAFHIEEYEKLPHTDRDDLLEEREDSFVEKLDPLDDRYYNIADMIQNDFENLATVASSTYK
jgi:hypothetical protein